jgi:hypothetical protein
LTDAVRPVVASAPVPTRTSTVEKGTFTVVVVVVVGVVGRLLPSSLEQAPADSAQTSISEQANFIAPVYSLCNGSD